MIRSIGFSGGGMKGILHLGVLQELSKRQTLYFPNGVYGCSVGSIIAACVAFEIPISNILKFIQTNNNIEAIIPKFNIYSLSNVFSLKGIFKMDTFEQRICELFKEHDIDIKNKKLSDAKMPLYIVASNITKGVPTLFSDNIAVLDALKASCCIPGLFQPFMLYGNLYIDGNHLVPSISFVMPKLNNSLAISLERKKKYIFTEETIQSISPFEYVAELYSMSSHITHNMQKDSRTLCLSYPNLYSDSDLSEFDINDILNSAGQQLNRFLLTQMIN